MLEFKTLALKTLPNDAHSGFFGDVTKKLAAAGEDVINAVEPLDK